MNELTKAKKCSPPPRKADRELIRGLLKKLKSCRLGLLPQQYKLTPLLSLCDILSPRGEGQKEKPLNILHSKGQGDSEKSLIHLFTHSHIHFPTLFPSKKCAFTLAEVLITLGIIGVVAAMTMPTLIQDKKVTERVSQLKKVYSVLSQAHMFAVQEFGTPDEWGMSDMFNENTHYIMATNMAKYLKLSQNCIDMSESDIRKVCNPSLPEKKFARSVILIDGTLVMFRNWSPNCTNDYSWSSGNTLLKNVCGQISIDLNGSRNPNKEGEDRFSFYFTKHGIVPFGVKDSYLEFEKACNKSIAKPYPTFFAGNMYGCTAWVLYNGNMDYLKCNDLSWDGKQTCK